MDPSKELVLEEFKEAATLHRLQNTLLFGQTTVFLVGTGALLSSFIHASSPSLAQEIALPACGAFLGAIFYAITNRAADFSHAARDRAQVLGEQLSFEIYAEGTVRERWPAAISSMRILYLVSAAGWVLALLNVLTGRCAA